MKLPEHPPKSWWEAFSPDFGEMIRLQNIPAMQEIIKKANREYSHWDSFKYYPMPDGVSPEVAWAVLTFVRSRQTAEIPLQDKSGEHFRYWFPDTVLRELNFIDKHAGDRVFAEHPETSASQQKYLVSSLMEEAIASSQLEGAATTREQAKELLRSGKKPRDVSEQMIVNNYGTILALKDLAAQPFTPGLIQQIQGMLTKDTLDDPGDTGRFRTEADAIQVIDRRDTELLFDPPPAGEIDERVRLLCDYVNAPEEDEFVHPVVKAVIVHFWLAYIHPFVDGNGRTARALFYWHLIKNGYWKFEYLAISRILKESPAQYARSFLYTETDANDLTYFIVHNLRSIHRAVEAFENYVQRKQRDIRDTAGLIREYPGLNHRQYELLVRALTRPEERYTIKTYATMNNVVYQTARTDLFGLERKGLIESKKLGREFYFLPVEDLRDKLSKGKGK